MLKTLILIVCAVGVWVVPVRAQEKSTTSQQGKPARPRTIVVYDKQKNETIVHTPVMSVREVPGRIEAMTPGGTTINLPSETLEIMAHYTYPGQSPQSPSQIILSFLSMAKAEFKYSAESQVVAETNGAQISLGKVVIVDRRPDPNLNGGYLRETLQVTLAIEDFKQLANSSKLKVKLEKTEFTLTANQLKLLRNLVESAEK